MKLKKEMTMIMNGDTKFINDKLVSAEAKLEEFEKKTAELEKKVANMVVAPVGKTFAPGINYFQHSTTTSCWGTATTYKYY